VGARAPRLFVDWTESLWGAVHTTVESQVALGLGFSYSHSLQGAFNASPPLSSTLSKALSQKALVRCPWSGQAGQTMAANGADAAGSWTLCGALYPACPPPPDSGIAYMVTPLSWRK
jgi:hypothetical protein